MGGKQRKNYLKAIELNPGFVQARSLYGMIYFGWVEGKFDKAEEQGRIATGLEPLSAIDHADFAWTLLMAGKFEESLVISKTGIELDNQSFLSHKIAGLCLIVLHRYDEAIATFQYLIDFSNRNQLAINGLIWAYCGNGNMAAAKMLKEELEKRSLTEYLTHTYLGISLAWLGDVDNAFASFEKALVDLDPLIVTIKCAPYIPDSVRNDPRFKILLDKFYFPE